MNVKHRELKHRGPIQLLATRQLGAGALEFIQQHHWIWETIPAIETIAAANVDWADSFLQDYALYGDKIVLLFSSAHAVSGVKRVMNNKQEGFPFALKTACVGQKTKAAAVKKLGADVFVAEKDSASLLQQLLPALAKDAVIIFFCGNRRLNTLPSGLMAAGFEVKEYRVYETNFLPVKVKRTYDAVLFFSPSGVESFFRVNGTECCRVGVALGQTTAAALRRFGAGTILVADKPDEISMLHSLEAHFRIQVR